MKWFPFGVENTKFGDHQNGFDPNFIFHTTDGVLLVAAKLRGTKFLQL